MRTWATLAVAAMIGGAALAADGPPRPDLAGYFWTPARGSVAAPVSYDQAMLVLTGEQGAAAIIFGDEIKEASKVGVKYQWRFLPRGGGKEQTGAGEVFEPKGKSRPHDHWQRDIQAGPLLLTWSYSYAGKGWVYYVPERQQLQLANAKTFVRQRFDDPPLPPVVVEPLDLSRYLK